MDFVSSFCSGSVNLFPIVHELCYFIHCGIRWVKRVFNVTDTRNVLLQILRDLKYQYRKLSVHACMFVLEETVSFINDNWFHLIAFCIQRLRISEWTLLTKKLLSQAIVSVFPVVKLRNNEKSAIVLPGWYDNRKF